MLKELPVIVLTFASSVAATSALAATQDELDRLYEALGTPQLMELLRAEGIDQSEEIRIAMFPDRTRGWEAIVSSIYNTSRMTVEFREGFDAELRDIDVAPLLAFFGSRLGKEVVSLEISAREALLDESVEEAAHEAYAAMSDGDPARKRAIDDFVDANDLIELNVAGALNASLAFYSGLADGGTLELSEDDMLREVWAQEPDIRAETSEWIFAYLAMAYEPLSDEDLAAYKAISVSDVGRDLNRALFAGFEASFDRISYSLGNAAARFMQGDDI